MLNPDRSPNTELFLDDKLHMSQAGYAIWKEVVEKYLSEVCQQTVSSGRKQRLPKLSGDPYEWYSNTLRRKMKLLVFGHAGMRMLVFPTLRGDLCQYEEQGMVEALRDRLESGRLQLFCIDGFDSQSLYNQEIPPRERILRHIDFERYVLNEVLPFSEKLNSNKHVAAHGCSLGGFHAVNIAFRHPDRFNRVVALSGRYDLTRSFGGGFRDLFDGYYDDNVYFNTPSHFLANVTDPTLLTQMRDLRVFLAVGEWDAFIENNRAFSQTLSEKGIKHLFRPWVGKAHDFHHWGEMIRLYT